jgi:hypothetical protein
MARWRTTGARIGPRSPSGSPGQDSESVAFYVLVGALALLAPPPSSGAQLRAENLSSVGTFDADPPLQRSPETPDGWLPLVTDQP